MRLLYGAAEYLLQLTQSIFSLCESWVKPNKVALSLTKNYLWYCWCERSIRITVTSSYFSKYSDICLWKHWLLGFLYRIQAMCLHLILSSTSTYIIDSIKIYTKYEYTSCPHWNTYYEWSQLKAIRRNIWRFCIHLLFYLN